MDGSTAIAETFFVGHLVDHAHLTRRDRAMVKTKAGIETDEYLVTNANLKAKRVIPLGLRSPMLLQLQRWDTRGRMARAERGRPKSGEAEDRGSEEAQALLSPQPDGGEQRRSQSYTGSGCASRWDSRTRMSGVCSFPCVVRGQSVSTATVPAA